MRPDNSEDLPCPDQHKGVGPTSLNREVQYNNKMNKASIATYYKDFPLKKLGARLSKHELDLYYAVIEVKIEHDRQSLAEFNPNLNVWEAVNLARSELKHCSFLRWLLDPRGSHYQGELFLKRFIERFIERFSERFPNEIPIDELSSCNVKSEDSDIADGRVDISITGRSFIIVIEAKIDAGEQEDQLKRYGNISEDVVIVFLTKDGREPKTGKADLCVAWKDIGEICKEFVKECKNPWLAELVRQYSIMSDTL